MDKKVLSSLQRQCARREYCSEDIRQKALKALDGDAQAASEMLEALLADGYVSDLRHASAYAREKAAIGGWGPIKIRYALRAKKISSETINEALQEIDCSAADARLERLIQAKKKSLEGDPQMKLKLIKFALSRGYEYDKVASLLD